MTSYYQVAIFNIKMEILERQSLMQDFEYTACVRRCTIDILRTSCGKNSHKTI
jgi:hypothetical protein